jgi:phosphoribosylaminoimidazole-succinocarboxamide synthase
MNEKIYKGSSKSLYEAEEEYTLIMSFDDGISNQTKEKLQFSGKGVINNSISAYIMQKLDMIGIETHLIEKINMRQQLIQFVDTYPIQIHICTVASGRYVSEFGMEEGFVFESPMIDFRVKNKDLGYPVINESQIIGFDWLSKRELSILKTNAMRVHDFLAGLFASVQIRLVDIKLEFGRVFNGEDFVTMLIDEISPDTCRLWDMETNEKLCFELAKDEPEKIIPAYQEVLKRLTLI